MGTRSDIIVHRADGKWARIYCHWDGYLSHNGKILFEHYTTQEKVEQLVALGDISSLNEEIGVKHPFDRPSVIDYKTGKPSRARKTFEKKYGKMCTAYGRDRGETGVDTQVFDSLSAAWPDSETGTEFTYVWDDGIWYVGDPDEGSQSLIPLDDALAGKKKLTPAVKAFGGNFVIGRHSGKV